MTMRTILLAALVVAGGVRAEVVSVKQVLDAGGGAQTNANFRSRASVGQSQAGFMGNTSFVGRAGFLAQASAEETSAESGLPLAYEFRGNHPNPFNPRTTLEFALPEATHVELRLYDLRGREVRELLRDRLEAGYHQFELVADGLSSGVYFARLVAGEFTETHKLVLLK